VIRINNQQFWLYAADDPATNNLLHVHIFSTTTTALTEILLCELQQTRCQDSLFFLDGATYLQAALQRTGGPIENSNAKPETPVNRPPRPHNVIQLY